MAYKSNFMTKSVILLFAVLVLNSATVGAYDKTEVESWLRQAEATLAKTESYTAIFYKQERIQGKLTDEETIFLKFKKPFKVYMKWTKEPYKGVESACNSNRIECPLFKLQRETQVGPGHVHRT